MSGLSGRCFVTFGDDRLISHQGLVIAEIADALYLVQYFDWIVGELSTMEIVGVEEMRGSPSLVRNRPGAWMFFEDDKHLKAWLASYGKQYLHYVDKQ